MNLDDVEFAKSSQEIVALVDMYKLPIPVELHISPDASLAQERQERMILSEFLVGWPDMEVRLRTAVFTYYLATCAAVEDSGTDIVSVDNIWSFAELQEVRVPEMRPLGRFVQILGRCSWEEEHGLEVCVRNGADIIYVGPFTGKSHREPNAGKPWNHAPDI